MSGNLENSAVATGLEKVSFHSNPKERQYQRKTQQWPQDWKRLVFILIPKEGNAKEWSNYHTNVVISLASKVMLKILQARLHQYVN